MGHVCDEALSHGVRVIGVLPRFMKGFEHPRLTECLWTERMSERKDLMREGTSLAIALPGGIGTIDEFIETHTLKKLHKWEGELFALNLDGYWDPYIALLDHMVDTAALSAQDRDLVHFPRTVAELIACFD